MRLVIDAATYGTVAHAFTSANQIAAIQYDALVGKLGSYAAMAGDDSTSADFAAAYDEAAAEAVGAFADLVPAFATLGRLTERSVSNHREADASSIVTGPVVYDGTTALPEGDYVAVLAASPPSALGGDSPALSSQATWILDHLEGFVWPNADTDRLRDAGRVWRMAGEGLAELTDRCREAVASLEAQSSPEIPLAVAAVAEIRSTLDDIAGEFEALATSCEQYAVHVDQKRREILALVEEILQMIVEGIVISVAIGLITGGTGAVAASGAVVARVAAQSPRFAAILNALRALVQISTTALRTSSAALRSSRLRLAKFADARLAMRNEFGQLRFGDDALTALRGWEKPGHTIERHVSKRVEDLAQRMKDEPWIEAASSYRTEAAAARIIHRVLIKNSAKIEDWLGGSRPTLAVRAWLSESTGLRVDRTGTVSDVNGALCFLVRAPSSPGGFRLHTSYPIP